MTHVRGGVVFAIVALIALFAAAVTAAYAHDGRPAASAALPMAPAGSDVAPGPTIAAVPPAAVVPFALLAALAIGGALTLACVPRRVIAMAVVPLIVLVMFETGVHGVHHLGDPRAAGQCSVAVTAEHIGGAVPDAPTDGAPLTLVSASAVLPDSSPCVGRHHRPDDGRAPPAPFA
jgi:hypothetical protein